MAPTLNSGDDILVDLGDRMERLRDGIYVMRADDVLVVKRLAVDPTGQAGHHPVGQSGLSGLARLRHRRDPRHRPGDLGGAKARLSRLALVSLAVHQPDHDRGDNSKPGAKPDSAHRIAGQKADDEAGHDPAGEETSACASGARLHGLTNGRERPRKPVAPIAPKPGQALHMVNAALTMLVGSPETAEA
jgi:hypothetical protein